MKKLNRILVAAAAAATLSFTLSARAGSDCTCRKGKPCYICKAMLICGTLKNRGAPIGLSARDELALKAIVLAPVATPEGERRNVSLAPGIWHNT